MNDRYLFRGKRLDNGEWVRGGYCEIPPSPQVFGELPPSRIGIFTEHPNTLTDWGMPRRMCLFDVNPVTVGQCTGLRDKNAKLIFEGDVVRFDSRTYENKLAVIEWHFRGLTGYVLKFGDDILLMDEKHSYEIISNIHDNL